jgi:hypothetical protein
MITKCDVLTSNCSHKSVTEPEIPTPDQMVPFYTRITWHAKPWSDARRYTRMYGPLRCKHFNLLRKTHMEFSRARSFRAPPEIIHVESIMWDFKFSRRRVWCSELSSGLYCRVKWWWWRQYAPLNRRSTIILHGSTTQKTALNIKLVDFHEIQHGIMRHWRPRCLNC